jgi:hypothetical protein
MSFTVDDIRDKADGYIDESVSDANAISWAYDCMVAIGGRAYREAMYEYDATENKWYALPTGFIRAVSVRDTIGSPEDLTITQGGTPGTTSYTYRVTAYTSDGESIACTAVASATGNATLSAVNYNTLTWTAVTGATGYYIYRTVSAGTPSTTGYIGTTTDETYDDDGDAGDSATVPYEDLTGDDYDDYTIRDRRIKFASTDKYVLTYITSPTKYTATSDTIDLPDLYIVPMAKFLAAKFLYMDERDETSTVREADRLMNDFYNDINSLGGEIEMETEHNAFQTEVIW